MAKILRTISAVALTTVSITGLALSGTAQAATYPSVKVKVCNATDRDRVYQIEGLNQDNAWTSYYEGDTIKANGGCHTVSWWWKTGQNVKISTFPTRWDPDTDRWTGRGYILPADAKNGSTRTATVEW
ncbi:hypothetical protein OG250_18230 [Streptomyces sp. NBC_00487]|uniref:hypothetical protein n=1 Tax=unclassified Streptomyces TaxID=2593676 RepID=UPI002DDC58EB|nr:MULTISPECIES: hypothetical protein [unclassified Streptomyces]WRY96649.1 hypothetical protein OG889_18995 [Streptomyces sp. NBC_00481]